MRQPHIWIIEARHKDLSDDWFASDFAGTRTDARSMVRMLKRGYLDADPLMRYRVSKYVRSGRR